MKVPRAPSHRRASINMTPMIDVVFLLVIFFLVSSHLVRQENQIELALPVAESGEEDADMTTPRITISVQDDGSLWMTGRLITATALPQRLAALKSEQGDDLEIRVRAGRALAYSAVEPVMLACTKAGVWNLTWAVYREDPPR